MSGAVEWAGRPITSWLVDAVLLVMIVEAVVLILHHRRTGQGLGPRDCFASLGAGLALVLALRGATGFADATQLAILLMVAGVMHAWDLRRRWPG